MDPFLPRGPLEPYSSMPISGRAFSQLHEGRIQLRAIKDVDISSHQFPVVKFIEDISSPNQAQV